jgi:hypothetical protein
MIRELWNDGWLTRSAVCFVGCAVISIPLMVVIAMQIDAAENTRWQAFKTAHDCKIVGRMSGSVTTTIAPIVGSKGNVAIGTSVSPDKTGWQCNDGVTYWR